MQVSARIEKSLEDALARVEAPESCPPRLAAAMRYAVFPRGARIRPRLTFAVATACGEDEPALVEAAAAAIELMHCASLVHDDLPCFDDADLRRGKPSLHRRFDAPLAVLAGDALIVLAFQALTYPLARPERLGAMVRILSAAVGAPTGIVAGQAWEREPAVDLATYHRQKTGALFAGAAMIGAAASGADAAPWLRVGEALGRAYQAADDIGDAGSDAETLGKPVGQDRAFGRPSLVAEFGIGGAVERFEALVAEALDAIPDCIGAADMKVLVASEARRLLPRHLAQRAA